MRARSGPVGRRREVFGKVADLPRSDLVAWLRGYPGRGPRPSGLPEIRSVEENSSGEPPYRPASFFPLPDIGLLAFVHLMN